jgi:tetratricopeptide (TPR) repeat protein
MKRLTSRIRTSSALALSIVLLGSFALAQAPDPQRAAAAQALYDQATAEMDGKQYASACRKLEEATSLVPEGIGAKLTLAKCYEALGRLASAWSQYALVQTLAAKAGQTERANRAAEKTAELRPKLATLVVQVPAEVRAIPGLLLTRDGAPLGEGQWGIPIPVDVGTHLVVAKAPDHKTWEGRVEVTTDGGKASLLVQPLAAEPKTARPSPVADAGPERPWQRPVGIAAMGLGGAGLALGAVLGSLAIAKKGESDESHCNAQNRCDPTGLEMRGEAVSLGNGSTVALAVGGAVLAGGIALFVTAPKADAERVGAANRPRNAEVFIGLGSVQARLTW